MGLKPLEYSDCYLDSPYFRDNVYEHERELERTSERIKGLIKECKSLLRAVDSKLMMRKLLPKWFARQHTFYGNHIMSIVMRSVLCSEKNVVYLRDQ